jgi:hypothetical protein
MTAWRAIKRELTALLLWWRPRRVVVLATCSSGIRWRGVRRAVYPTGDSAIQRAPVALLVERRPGGFLNRFKLHTRQTARLRASR